MDGMLIVSLVYSIYVMEMVGRLGVFLEEMWVGALLYDNVVLLADSVGELQKMIDMVGAYAVRWKFKFKKKMV